MISKLVEPFFRPSPQPGRTMQVPAGASAKIRNPFNPVQEITMAMDVQRDPAILKRKKLRRTLFGIGAVAVIIAVSVAVSQLEQAAPTVSGSSVYFGTVKRGPFVREVRGAGNLVPEDIRIITT